jgi:hypothetical protein
MTTAGVNITKANIVAYMESIRTAYNGGIGWATNANPFTQFNPMGGDTNGVYTGSFVDGIGETYPVGSTITNNFREYARALSRIRNTRFLQWYQVQGEPRASVLYDNTVLTHLNDNYARAMTDIGGPGTGSLLSAADLDSFVNTLSSYINSYRTTTVTLEEFYCHSNCHGSCHGSI